MKNDSKQKKYVKFMQCNRCDTCLLPNCGICINCKDKEMFGGLGIRKKRCIARICEYKQETFYANILLEILHS